MIDEPLDRCVCTGLAGFLFEDQPGIGRTVAIGCSACGIQTESFPLDRADDAIMAWEAGDFADGPVVTPRRDGTLVSRGERAALGRRSVSPPTPVRS